MAAIFVITVKGFTNKETHKNLQLIDSFMTSNQSIFKLVSDPSKNPRVYYNERSVIAKDIHDIISGLRADKDTNNGIKNIQFNGSLSKT